MGVVILQNFILDFTFLTETRINFGLKSGTEQGPALPYRGGYRVGSSVGMWAPRCVPCVRFTLMCRWGVSGHVVAIVVRQWWAYSLARSSFNQESQVRFPAQKVREN